MFTTGTKQLNANMLTPLQNDIFDMFSQTVEYIIESCCIVSEKKDKDKDETHFINHHSQTVSYVTSHEKATRHAVRTDFLHLLNCV